MKRNYSNPPIIEALCELIFFPSSSWDMTIPGLFYEKIKDEFPTKQQHTGIGIDFKPLDNDRNFEQRFEMSQRMQFFKTDKTSLIQISKDLLVINQLKPYSGWENFKPVILKKLNVYSEIAKPDTFKQIALRYLNQITIPKNDIQLKDYFNFYPYLPEKLSQIPKAFNISVDLSNSNPLEHLSLTLTTSNINEEFFSFILEIASVYLNADILKIGDFDSWLENAHEQIEQVFEECITDKSRKIFGEVIQ
jgi:uncharacterized protein (TIGR04255 family)